MSSSAIASNSISAERPLLPRLATGIVIGLCAAKLLLHVFTSVRHYGYFRERRESARYTIGFFVFHNIFQRHQQ